MDALGATILDLLGKGAVQLMIAGVGVNAGKGMRRRRPPLTSSSIARTFLAFVFHGRGNLLSQGKKSIGGVAPVSTISDHGSMTSYNLETLPSHVGPRRP